jgi:hypothetical protein
MPAAKGGFGFVGVGYILGSAMGNIPGINQNLNLYWVVPTARAALNSAQEPSLSALDTYTIDAKIDDGKPNTGRFIASTWAKDSNIDSSIFDYYYWTDGSVDYHGNPLDANSTFCTIGGSGDPYSGALATDVQYNTNPAKGGKNTTCMPMFLW